MSNHNLAIPKCDLEAAHTLIQLAQSSNIQELEGTVISPPNNYGTLENVYNTHQSLMVNQIPKTLSSCSLVELQYNSNHTFLITKSWSLVHFLRADHLFAFLVFQKNISIFGSDQSQSKKTFIIFGVRWTSFYIILFW